MADIYDYQVTAKWEGGRGGSLWSETKPAPGPVLFSAPPEFKGEGGQWTPEHLLTAAVASCFVSTFCGIAEANHFVYEKLNVTVRGSLGKNESGWRFTTMALRPTLVVDTADQTAVGKRLLEKAERSCLIARSLACPLTMEPAVLVAEPSHAV